MTTHTLTEAVDAVYKLVNDAWLAAGASASVPMTFEDVRADKPGEDGTTTQAGPWARTSIRIIGASQITQGTRRFGSTGVVTVQIFTPMGEGRSLSDQLAQIVLDVLRAKASSSAGLHFFDQAPAEIGTDGPWFQTNVGSSFRFQEVAA